MGPGSPGAREPGPLIFKPNWGLKSRKQFFLDTAPPLLISGLAPVVLTFIPGCDFKSSLCVPPYQCWFNNCQILLKTEQLSKGGGGKWARLWLKEKELYPLPGSDLSCFTFKGAFQEHIWSYICCRLGFMASSWDFSNQFEERVICFGLSSLKPYWS